jgi:hypothetical protein
MFPRGSSQEMGLPLRILAGLGEVSAAGHIALKSWPSVSLPECLSMGTVSAGEV